MLRRIEEIHGVGLLHQANGKSHACSKATFIYADNGRGKSTLATILRSASTRNAGLIAAFKTLDGPLPPRVVLQFENGKKIVFENGTWSDQRPELVVFDGDFIGRNVHSGGAVGTDHRKNLLEFALGEAAVAARAAVDKATNESKEATDKVQSFMNQLLGYHLGQPHAEFEQLAQVSEVDIKIADVQKRLSAANNAVSIQARPVPKLVTEPSFDVTGLFDTLGLSLKDVHADAEKVVKQHVAKLGGDGAENWLSQGGKFSAGTACPFCDQDISSNDLVLAYQTHFNEAYRDLKVKVTALSSMVTTGTATNSIDFFAQHVGVAVAQASAWIDQVPTQLIKFDADVARVSLAAFREFVADLTLRKSAAPTESLGTEADKTKANTLWEQLLNPIRAANASIKAANELISAYKCQLVSDSVPVLQQQVQQLQAIKRRYDLKTIDLFLQLNAARKIVETADKVKKAARDSLDGFMVATLGKYQKSINALLQSFGASFSINGMSANFRGNAPRSEYGLLLRGKNVPLEGGPPSFATALSDGDKRTLAFAFFVASALEDPKLSTRTIVIDDPMCSLDLNRRHQTQTVLMQLYTKAAQLIVLAHDPYFLRDLRGKLLKQDKTALVAVFQLVAVQHNYTDFAEFDIDKVCESLYFQHHRLLNNHVAGTGSDPSAVAKSIRPMLEGYLRRRFPGLIPQGIMFGDIVLKIGNAVAPSPLCHAQNLIDELNDINGYAGQFHHDQSDTVKIAPGELMGFVNRALIVVYKSAPL